ncbi:RidA family protein [Pacificispira sp.]|uniref:RidA family protein n=1 Tax=Pacificispira sp. TaxID=2888761 RepID=UPI003BAB4D03
MAPSVETMVPEGSPPLIGPYSHVAKAGNLIMIGGVGGIDRETGQLAGPDVAAQAVAILNSFDHMLRAAGSDLDHAMHIHVFLKDMADFERMNAAYISVMGERRPARTVIAAHELPKPAFRVLMNLTAVTRD